MKDQLDLLWELQRIDLDLQSIKTEKDRFPKEMKKLDEKQKLEKERIQKEKEKLELLEKERRQKERDLGVEQEKIKKTEGRVSEVKTNKEYQAFLAEIENFKKVTGRIEEEILQVMVEIDELKKDFAKREKEMSVNLEKIEGESRKIQERMNQIDVDYHERTERRGWVAKQLESKLLELYQTLKERRQGIGMVGVKKETCQGCFVHIPPQMFNEVQKNNALIRCPNCNRILYWEENQKAG